MLDSVVPVQLKVRVRAVLLAKASRACQEIEEGGPIVRLCGPTPSLTARLGYRFHGTAAV
jgi:hypothetical protein